MMKEIIIRGKFTMEVDGKTLENVATPLKYVKLKMWAELCSIDELSAEEGATEEDKK